MSRDIAFNGLCNCPSILARAFYTVSGDTRSKALLLTRRNTTAYRARSPREPSWKYDQTIRVFQNQTQVRSFHSPIVLKSGNLLGTIVCWSGIVLPLDGNENRTTSTMMITIKERMNPRAILEGEQKFFKELLILQALSHKLQTVVNRQTVISCFVLQKLFCNSSLTHAWWSDT